MKYLLTMILALSVVACASPEEKAKEAIADYETKVFAKCKEMTDEAKLAPGAHRCSQVSSMALEMALKDSGLAEAEWQKIVAEWQSSDLGKYYVDAKARESMPK